MSADWAGFLTQSLESASQAGLRRTLRTVDSPQAAEVVISGKRLANFSSNDYLGLASHPALREAAAAEWERGGFGAGASRLACGNLAAHVELEATIAAFKGTGSALAFSSGYAAALGTIPSICAKGDIIILDKLCHACLVDAARLSGAALRVFPHNDLNRLESHLRWASQSHPKARVLVVAESVYSMDGDTAPLREIVALKDQHGAWLFLDEAHGVGVLGDHGRGLADAQGVAGRIEVQMGTLGKAMGAHGAYIAGSAALRDFLVNFARSFIYSTAPPAPVAAAANRAFEILAGAEGAERLASLWRNIRSLHAALSPSPDLPPPDSAILPIILGGESAAMSAASRLLDQGFLVPAIRFPTVARGSARLRVTLSASHSQKDIEALAGALTGGI